MALVCSTHCKLRVHQFIVINRNICAFFSMYRKVQRVQKVLKDAALHTEKFRKASGISCASGCHKCCLKQDIAASPLEFLPFAYHLFKEGQAEAFYDKLEQSKDENLCVLFSAMGKQGGCQAYEYRGLICRLFGYSVNPGKDEVNRLVTCKIIRESEPARFIQARHLQKAPVFRDYYAQLATIDFRMAYEQVHINEAIKQALEMVLRYYMYRKPRKLA